MTTLNKLTKTATKLITSAGALALIAGLSLSLAPQANAFDCLLDTNNDGDADSNVDTDGGANSAGSSFRLACGVAADATGGNATALGHLAIATGNRSTAVGSSASATGDFSAALGRLADASGESSTALGQGAAATGLETIALGQGSNAAGSASTALGQLASAAGVIATALGHSANASGFGSTALGYRSEAGVLAIAIGADSNDVGLDGAQALGTNSIVIGSDANDASFADTVIIGFGATATEADQVILKNAATFTILGNGNVGMGTAAPAGNLDIDSGGAVDTTLLLSNTGAQWELKSKANTGRLNFKNLIAGGVPFKLGPTAVNSLLSVGTAADDLVEVRGALDVDGDVTVTGTLTTGGPTCGGGCDAVFDADYDLPSIEEHAALMFANKHLPEVGPTIPHAPINLSEQYGRMLNELEKAHIYIAQQESRISGQEARLAKLEKIIADLTISAP